MLRCLFCFVFLASVILMMLGGPQTTESDHLITKSGLGEAIRFEDNQYYWPNWRFLIFSMESIASQLLKQSL